MLAVYSEDLDCDRKGYKSPRFSLAGKFTETWLENSGSVRQGVRRAFCEIQWNAEACAKRGSMASKNEYAKIAMEAKRTIEWFDSSGL